MMQAEYHILSNITFRHQYFSNRKLECLSVQPAQGSRMVMQNLGLLFKPFKDGFILLYETSGNEPDKRKMIATGDVLRFYLTLNDSNFFNYTDTEIENLAGSVYYFHNNRTDEAKPDAPNRLHSGDIVSKEDVFSCNDMDEKFLTKPFAIIDIYMTNNMKTEYSITFKEKHTYWRYILVSEYFRNLKQPAILGEHYVFDGPFEVHLPDKREALYFVSTVSIGLSQEAVTRFKLVENYENGSSAYKIIKHFLPVPGITSVSSFGTIDAKDKNCYSEMYIY
jgi:hypothetical protein